MTGFLRDTIPHLQEVCMAKKRQALLRRPKATLKRPSFPRNPLNQATIWPVRGTKANWAVTTLPANPGSDVQWLCGKLNFKIWFPGNRNPLVGSNEVDGMAGVANAQVRPNVTKGEQYYYCALVQDSLGKVHIVAGNSPPEMEIV